jgi:oligopeptide/dipeptide ABC transporter ATP-binding protein
MYLGKIVEMGTMEQIVEESLHPYTNALMVAVPDPDPRAERSKVVIKGEVPSPIHLPLGCRFCPRCPKARPECKESEPTLLDVGKGHVVACHLYS